MPGCAGVALYHTERIGAMQAFAAGEAFFEKIDTSVTGTSYYELLEHGDHEGDHDLVETSPEQLRAKIGTGEAAAFWMYSQQRGTLPWDAAFTYQTSGYGSFPHIAVFCDSPSEDTYSVLKEWLRHMTEQFSFPYAILYETRKMTDAMSYAAGDNGKTAFPYEKAFAFNKETPGLYGGQARYTGSKLRMVYPANVLNGEHLSIGIAGTNLENWIQSCHDHGILYRVGEERWMWEVAPAKLEQVNQICGEAGALIAWQPRQTKKPRRKLP